jgi:Mg/Co/Ni transporter MgtE
MSDATRNFDLHVIEATPWARNTRKFVRSRSRHGWRTVLREVSVVAAILAFAVAVVALRFAISVQTVIDPRLAGAVSAIAALVGVAALAGVNMPDGDAS